MIVFLYIFKQVYTATIAATSEDTALITLQILVSISAFKFTEQTLLRTKIIKKCKFQTYKPTAPDIF